MMRILTILTVLAALAWSGYWVAGRAALSRGIDAALVEARRVGWQLGWDELSVAGFPNRFDTSILGLRAAGPDGWGVAAPRLDLLALSYRPNDLRAVAATPLTVETPAGPVRVRAAALEGRAQLTVAIPPEPRFATVQALDLTAEARDLTLTATRAQLSARAAAPQAYDIALSAEALAVAGLDAALPARFETVEVDATATLDRPLPEEPRLAALQLRRAEIVWGETRADLTGDIGIGPSGLPEGDLLVTVAEWRALLPLLEGLGLPPLQTTLLTAGIAGLETEDGRVEIPLTLAEGTLRFGAIPLAPLPRLPPPGYNP